MELNESGVALERAVRERERLAEEQVELTRDSEHVAERRVAAELLESKLVGERAELDSEKSRRFEWQETMDGQAEELRRR